MKREDIEAMAPFAQSIVNAAPTATCCAVHGVGAALLAARIMLETSRRKLTPEDLVIFEREFARVRKEVEELKLEHQTASAPGEAVH